MTKEIAIHNLYALKLRSKSLSDRDALDMAIKALEQQPCEDCISREKAVYVASGYCAPQNIADELRRLPSVTPSYNLIKTELDCISRQAVLEYIEGSGAELGHGSENELVCQDIKNLPSVIPIIPKGKWKPLNYKDEMWGYVYECSNCGAIDYENDYCSNCGAKMEVTDEN